MLENYEQSLVVLCRYFPTVITHLFATLRRSSDGSLEWWSDREGQSILLNALPATERAMLQEKCLSRQEAILLSDCCSLNWAKLSEKAQWIWMLLHLCD